MFPSPSPSSARMPSVVFPQQMEEMAAKLKEERQKRHRLKEFVAKERQQHQIKLHKLKNDLRRAQQKQQQQHDYIAKLRAHLSAHRETNDHLRRQIGQQSGGGALFDLKVRLASVRNDVATLMERAPVFSSCSDRLILFLEILGERISNILSARDKLQDCLTRANFSHHSHTPEAEVEKPRRKQREDMSKLQTAFDILEDLVHDQRILAPLEHCTLWRKQAQQLNITPSLSSIHEDLKNLIGKAENLFKSQSLLTPDAPSEEKRRRKSTGESRRRRKKASMDSRSISPQSIRSMSLSISSAISLSSDVDKSHSSKDSSGSRSSGGRAEEEDSRPSSRRVQKKLQFEDVDEDVWDQRGRDRREVGMRSHSDIDTRRIPLRPDPDGYGETLEIPIKHRRRRSRSVPRPFRQQKQDAVDTERRSRSPGDLPPTEEFFGHARGESSDSDSFPDQCVTWHSPVTSQVTVTENDLLENFQANDIRQAIRSGTLSQIVPFLVPLSVHILKYSPNESQWHDYTRILQQRMTSEADFRQAVQFLIHAYPDRDLRNLYSFSKTLDSAFKKKRNFFNGLLTCRKGAAIEVPEDLELRDPVFFAAPRLCEVRVRKIFKSNTRPILLDCFVRSGNVTARSSSLILKYGHDLRRDVAILNMFRYMNWLWSGSSRLVYHGHQVQSFVYQVIAFTERFGCIQYVHPSTRLRHVRRLQNVFRDHQISNLVATAAGGFIACHVMGVRDRHFDNVLVRDQDGTLFHIDFDYVLGDTLKFDTDDFAITPDLYQLMRDHWEPFVEMCWKSFFVLRENSQLLIRFAQSTFHYLFDAQQIERFISAQLRLAETDLAAEQWLRRSLAESPQNTRTRLKNVVHKMNAW